MFSLRLEPSAPPAETVFQPSEPDGVFLVASVTKPVTAIALMQLVERGLLSLTDPVQRYIPEFSGPGKELIR
ncbi:MAG TPA: hypothetical protein DIC52_26235, partial [Candidatus Latescibacteria bacterium]|nr:hypothetical protein [Candidatus Latescibacterota bacterium]